MPPAPVRAVLWDFDNTLVDTRARNRSVTRTILAELTGRDPDEFPTLRTQDAYDRAIHRTQDWQELYRREFHLGPELIRRAGRMWTEAQLGDRTRTSWFEDIRRVVRALDRWPQAIVSLNTRANIVSALEEAGVGTAFDLVLGCEEVEHERQKPRPDGLLRCVETLIGRVRGSVFYVGDHPIDAECAANANAALEAEGHPVRVVAIGASYGGVAASEPWPVEPPYRAGAPAEILDIVASAADSRPRP